MIAAPMRGRAKGHSMSGDRHARRRAPRRSSVDSRRRENRGRSIFHAAESATLSPRRSRSSYRSVARCNPQWFRAVFAVELLSARRRRCRRRHRQRTERRSLCTTVASRWSTRNGDNIGRAVRGLPVAQRAHDGGDDRTSDLATLPLETSI
jgi:hypothetical protein